MKHSFIRGALLLAFAGILAGCSLNGGASSSGGESSLPGQTLGGVIGANVTDPTAGTTSAFVTSQVEGQWDRSSFGWVNDKTYANLGLLVARNSNGNVGFYSLAYQKFLVAPLYVPAWLSYQVQADSNVGFFLFIHYMKLTVVYDSLGNTLYTNEDAPAPNAYPTLASYLVGTEVYVQVNWDYGQYQADGTIQWGVSLPSAPAAEVVFNSNDFFADPSVLLDLKDYGYEGYTIARNTTGYCTVFDRSHNAVASFILPTPLSAAGLIGNILFYQYTVALPDEAASYSFSDNGKKYSLTSGRLDILTGQVVSADLPFVVSSLSSYKDSSGSYLLAVASLRKIDQNKALSPLRQYLMDKAGVLYDDVSGLEPNAFIKLDDTHYYNANSKIIFNANLKPLCYLAGMNPILLSDAQCFYGSYNGKFGTVDYNGIVQIPFKYDSLVARFEKGYTIGTINGTVYRVKSSGTPESLGASLQAVTPGLYVYRNPSQNVLVLTGLDQDYAKFDSGYHVAAVTPLASPINHAYYAFATICDEEGYVQKAYTFAANSYPNGSSFTTKGTEVLSPQDDGTEFASPISLLEDADTTIVQAKSSGAYCSFTPSQDSSYNLVSSAATISLLDSAGAVMSSSNDKLTFSGTKDTPVHFLIKSYDPTAAYPYGFIANVYPNDGRDISAPLSLVLGDNQGKFMVSSGVYLAYSCLASGSYTLAAPNCWVNLEGNSSPASDSFSVDLTQGEQYIFNIQPDSFSSGARWTANFSAEASLLTLGASFLNPFPLTKRVAQTHDLAASGSACFRFVSDGDSPYRFTVTQPNSVALWIKFYRLGSTGLQEVRIDTGSATTVISSSTSCDSGLTLYIAVEAASAVSGASFLLTGDSQGRTAEAPIDFALGTANLASASYLRYYRFTALTASHYLFTAEGSSSFNLVIKKSGSDTALYSQTKSNHLYETDLAVNDSLYFLVPATSGTLVLGAFDLKAGAALTLDSAESYAFAAGHRLVTYSYRPSADGLYPYTIASYSGSFTIYDGNGAVLGSNTISSSSSSYLSLSAGTTYYFAFFSSASGNGSFTLSAAKASLGSLTTSAPLAVSLDASADSLVTYDALTSSRLTLSGTGFTTLSLRVVDTASGVGLVVTMNSTNNWSFTVTKDHHYVLVFTNANAATSGTLALNETASFEAGSSLSLALAANVSKTYSITPTQTAFYAFNFTFASSVTATLTLGSTSLFSQSGSTLNIQKGLKANSTYTLTLTSTSAQSGTAGFDFVTLTGNASLSVPVESNTIYVVRFIPATSGSLVFLGTNTSGDTFAYLYDANMAQLANNDDGGSNNNFKITYSVTAGTVYFLGPRFYNVSSTGTVSFTTTLS